MHGWLCCWRVWRLVFRAFGKDSLFFLLQVVVSRHSEGGLAVLEVFPSRPFAVGFCSKRSPFCCICFFFFLVMSASSLFAFHWTIFDSICLLLQSAKKVEHRLARDTSRPYFPTQERKTIAVVQKCLLRKTLLRPLLLLLRLSLRRLLSLSLLVTFRRMSAQTEQEKRKKKVERRRRKKREKEKKISRNPQIVGVDLSL